MVDFNYLSLNWFSLIPDFWLNHQGQYSTTSLAEPSGEFDLEFVGQCLSALEWRYGRLWDGHDGYDQQFCMCKRFLQENKFDPTTNSMNGFFSFQILPKQKQSWQKSRFCKIASRSSGQKNTAQMSYGIPLHQFEASKLQAFMLLKSIPALTRCGLWLP